MTRQQKEPLRVITSEERQALERISRATSESVSCVARAQALLAVAEGLSYTAAAQACSRRSGDAVAKLVERFNRAGLAALTPQHGGGGKSAIYGTPTTADFSGGTTSNPNWKLMGSRNGHW